MPQYRKNVLAIEPMISIGFNPLKESKITTANNPIGKKKTERPTREKK